MKRFLSSALVVLLLPALMSTPVMADNVSVDNWFNYLDYGYIFDGSNYMNFLGTYAGEIKLADVDRVFYSYVDFIVYTDCPDLEFSKYNYYNPSLTKVDLGGGYYRFYGDISRGFANNSLYWRSRSGSGQYMMIVSFRASTLSYQQLYYRDVIGTLVDDNNPEGLSFTYSAASHSPVRVDLETVQSANNFECYFQIPNWKAMDYISLSFAVNSSSITSLSVFCDAIELPYLINHLDNPLAGTPGVMVVNLLIDIRGIDKASTDSINVAFTGLIRSSEDGYIDLLECTSMVSVDPPSVITIWFERLHGWISAQTDAIVAPIVEWGGKLLDGINALPDKIAEALKAVIVPSDSAVQNMGQQSEELAQDRFGGAYEGALIIDEFASQLRPQQATQILTVPVVNLDILGVPFPLGGWEVDLVPDGSELIVETCKILIDIVATLAFVNGLRNRLERTLEK